METFIKLLAHLALLFLSGLIVFLLWNVLMPEIFNLPTITYMQSIGLTLLCNALFAPKKID